MRENFQREKTYYIKRSGLAKISRATADRLLESKHFAQSIGMDIHSADEVINEALDSWMASLLNGRKNPYDISNVTINHIKKTGNTMAEVKA